MFNFCLLLLLLFVFIFIYFFYKNTEVTHIAKPIFRQKKNWQFDILFLNMTVGTPGIMQASGVRNFQLI